MKNLVIAFSALFIAVLILTACARPPVDEMNKAHDAVIRAENDADAVNYAPNTLIRARDALTRMQSEADARRFDEARNFANEAIRIAEGAIAEGRTGEVRARDEAANLVSSLEVPLAETSSVLSAARQAGNLDLDFDALSGDLDSARLSYDDARQSLADNNFRDAIARSQNVRSLLSDINARINQAAQVVIRK
jgi:hypothetical protein